MRTLVTYKNIKSSDKLREYAQEKLGRLDRLLDKPATATVVFHKEKLQKNVEISLTSGAIELHAKESHAEMRAAIDLVTDKLKKQITSTKEKSRMRRTRTRGMSLGQRFDVEEAHV